jgi:hypothetical protein
LTCWWQAAPAAPAVCVSTRWRLVVPGLNMGSGEATPGGGGDRAARDLRLDLGPGLELVPARRRDERGVGRRLPEEQREPRGHLIAIERPHA